MNFFDRYASYISHFLEIYRDCFLAKICIFVLCLEIEGHVVFAKKIVSVSATKWNSLIEVKNRFCVMYLFFMKRMLCIQIKCLFVVFITSTNYSNTNFFKKNKKIWPKTGCCF